MGTAPAWQPVLCPPLRERAFDAIERISISLSELDQLPRTISPLCDAALLLAYRSTLHGGRGSKDLAVEALNRAADAINSRTECWLFGGLAGFGWVVEHVTNLIGEAPEKSGGESEDDPLSEIDAELLARLKARPWAGRHDLVHGLAGIGVYFLERLPRPTAVQGLIRILEHLEESSEQSWGGATWRTSVELLDARSRRMSPGGYYDLGAAHGVPGVIHFLSELVAAGIESARSRSLLESAMRWLVARLGPPDRVSRYSPWFAPGVETGETNLAWCYGDLGLAALISHVGERCERTDWSNFAEALLDRCLVWPEDKQGIVDAALCHGAAGVAHIYHRAYQRTRKPEYKAGAVDWFEKTLEFRKPQGGIAGFYAWRPNTSVHLHPDSSLLSGAAGVALALLSAVEPVEPEWDRLLQLSGRSWG